MPKTEIRYDDRLMLKLESELHQHVKAHAKREGISTSEAIRRAIAHMLYNPPACKQLEHAQRKAHDGTKRP